MSRSFRVDFTKGISAVVEPRLLGDGYAVFVDNADMTAFAASSYRLPVFRQVVPDGTKHVFEYRGKWHFSSEHRYWSAEFYGKQERLYYTESGYIPGPGKPAMKIIDGVEARLGTMRPAASLSVKSDLSAAPGGCSIVIASVTGSSFPDGTLTYRLGFRTSYGLIPAGEAMTIMVLKGNTVSIKWIPVNLEDVTSIVIYGRTSNSEQILDEVSVDTTAWIDNGSLSPHGEYAANLDSTDVYFYFHTFLRNVNGHLDESGPGPLSPRIDQGKVNKITRNPELEGLFDGSSAVTGAPSYHPPASQTIVGSQRRAIGGLRILTTAADHNLESGHKVGVVPVYPSVDPDPGKRIYGATLFTTDLPAPTITSFGPGSTTAPVWAAGQVLHAKVTAFRGCGWDTLAAGSTGGVPAESLPSAEVIWTTTAAKGLLRWSYPSGDADGFHVYLNGLWVATVPAGVFFLEFQTLTGNSSRPMPTVNTSRARAFYFPDDAALLWDQPTAFASGKYGDLVTTIETKVVQTNHGLTKDELLSFSGYSELKGYQTVSRIGNANEFYVEALTIHDDATSPSRSYRVVNQALKFVDKWALYVQRGGTDGIALQQGVYPITQTEVVDLKPVHGLSVTCDSSYLAPTPEGDVRIEFNPPPLGMSCPTLHNEILFAIYENSVIWTPVNRHDAFPKAYRRNFPSPPTAIIPYAGDLIVLLPEGIGRFGGTDPSNLSWTMTDVKDGCIARNSVQHTSAGLVYLSPRGLMAFQAGINSSIPLSDGKIEPSLFRGASSTSESDRWPWWWIPSRSSAAWAKLTLNLPTADGWQRERLIDETLPIDGPIDDIRSFYWRGNYYLYFTGTTFGNHGTIVVDTTRRNESGYPISHIGLRPEHAHVTKQDQAFVLLGVHPLPIPPPPPTTSVTITSPL